MYTPDLSTTLQLRREHVFEEVERLVKHRGRSCGVVFRPDHDPPHSSAPSLGVDTVCDGGSVCFVCRADRDL